MMPILESHEKAVILPELWGGSKEDENHAGPTYLLDFWGDFEMAEKSDFLQSRAQTEDTVKPSSMTDQAIYN